MCHASSVAAVMEAMGTGAVTAPVSEVKYRSCNPYWVQTNTKSSSCSYIHKERSKKQWFEINYFRP